MKSGWRKALQFGNFRRHCMKQENLGNNIKENGRID